MFLMTETKNEISTSTDGAVCLCVLTGRRCHSSQPQRQRVRHAVFSLACEGVAGTQQSTSTDGSLTVLNRPDAGKKLGSRRRPRADRTTTQNKKQKLINLSSCDMLSLYCCMQSLSVNHLHPCKICRL